MQCVTCNHLTYHTADLLATAGGVVHGFSTRLGGVSRGDCAGLNLSLSRGDDPTAVFENYRLFCGAIGADASKLAKTRQVHSDHIRIVEQPGAEWEEDADGLITNVPGIALTVFYADCIPILLYDPHARVIAAVHAGWRGTALGIVDQAVDIMCARYGARPNDIIAAIGSGIGVCCFETDADVPHAMRTALGDHADPFITTRNNGKYHLDLKGINAFRLSRKGVLQIEVSDLCTCCHPELYWSHRKVGNKRGNQGAMIALT